MTPARSALVAGVVALALLAAGVFLFVLEGGPEVSANVLVNPPGIITANNSPTLARNPVRPSNLVVAHRIDRPGFSALVEWSDDGGVTWRPTTIPLPPDTPACNAGLPDPVAGGVPRQLPCPFAPDVAFAPDGTLFVLYVELQGNGNTPARLWMTTSADGGATMAPPVPVAGPLTFQPRLAVDPEGTVHAVWLQAENVALNRLVGPATIVAARSGDGGRSFSAPVPVSDPARPRVGAATPVITTDGALVVLYQDFKDDRRDFEGLEGPPAEGPFALVVARSDDDGQSFTPGVELESGIVPTRRFLVFLPEHPSIAAGPEGVLYVTWHSGVDGDDEDVFLRRSDDGGATWGGAVRVNDNPAGDGTRQYLPRVAVAPGGRVDVLFYDRRLDPADVLTDAFLASSQDNGATFTNQRVSSMPFDSRVGPVFNLFDETVEADFGTRTGLHSTDGAASAVWTDTRLGSLDDGRQDVFTATVSGLGPSGFPWAVAATAAVVALGLTWFTRRRSVKGAAGGVSIGRAPSKEFVPEQRPEARE